MWGWTFQRASGTHLYVEVGDLEEAPGRVEALGGCVERRRTAPDPTGVTFGMWTAHPGAAT